MDAKKPMRRDDLFRIASQTKAIVSVAAMQLFEQGKFYLDEPVADFLPAFRHPTVLDTYNAADTTYTTIPAKREITFRDLLTHTSGLDYPGIGTEKMRAIYAKAHIPSGLGSIDYDLKERMQALGRLPLAHQPGEKWTYGLNIDLLGCLVEVISGMDLEQVLIKNIFGPLGMKDTRFNELRGRTSARTGSGLYGRFLASYNPLDKEPHRHRSRLSAGTQTLFLRRGRADLHRLGLCHFPAVMMLNGGEYNGARILAPRTVQLMTSGQLPFLYDGQDNFGLGFGITSERSAARKVRNEGTFAWGGYFGTTYWADPKAKMICLIMTQLTPNSHVDLEQKLEQVIYQSFVK